MLSDLLSGVGSVLGAPRRYLAAPLLEAAGLPSQGNELVAHLSGLDPDSTAAHVLGFGAEMATDPLVLGGGALARALTKGYQGVRAMGMLNKARNVPMGLPVAEAAPRLLTHAPEAALADGFSENVGMHVGQSLPPEAFTPMHGFEDMFKDNPAAVEALNRIGAPPPPATPFYSRLERALESDPAKQYKTQGLIERLQQGKIGGQGPISPEELQYVEMQHRLAGKPTIGREELLNEIRNQDPLRLNKVVAGAPAWTPEEHALYRGARQFPEQMGSQEFDLLNELEAKRTSDATRWEQYQTPGGENYRETLLTLPDTGRGVYKSPHFDEPNIVAHLRTNERTLPGGKRALHAEEIQSDWHQAGAKEGYLTEEQAAEISAAQRARDEAYHAYTKAAAETGSSADAYEDFRLAENALGSLKDRLESIVPDAPFKTAWPDLGLKQLLHDAAAGGYDYATWNPGEQIQKIVGGGLEGQQQFYDKVLPARAAKLMKPFGGSVDKVSFGVPHVPRADHVRPAVENIMPDVLHAHGIALTTELRKAILEKGFPYLSALGGSGALASLLQGES